MIDVFLVYVGKDRKQLTIDNGELIIREGKILSIALCQFSILNSPIMAGDQVAIIVMEMHAASFAIAEHVAVCALSFPCPFSIAIFIEAVPMPC